jgi:integrase
MQTVTHQQQPIKTRSPKGSVTLQERKYGRRFKYTANHERRSLRLPAKGVHTKAFEDSLKKTIELDLLNDRHDHTQERYKLMIKTGVIPFVDANIVFAPATRQNTPAAPVTVTSFAPVPAYKASKQPIVIGMVQVPIEQTTAVQEPVHQPETAIVTETAPTPAQPAVKQTALQKLQEKRANKVVTFVECPRLNQPFALEDAVLYFCQQNGRNEEINHYKSVVNMAKKWGKVNASHIPTLLNNENYAYDTYHTRRSMISAMFDFFVEVNLADRNPFSHVPPRDKPEIKPENRQRISDAQMYDVLQAIKNDTYTNLKNRRSAHSDYYPFIYFLASMGTRPAEAIGLQVKKINFEQNTVLIDQALARVIGTCSAGREMKETKTGTKRTITVKSPELMEILKKQCEGKAPNDFVFLSKGGKTMDDVSVGNVLKAVLKQLGIERKVLYFLRHCFVSRCIQQGLSILEIMKLVGHVDERMILKVYGEITGQIVTAPEIDKNNKR